MKRNQTNSGARQSVARIPVKIKKNNTVSVRIAPLNGSLLKSYGNKATIKFSGMSRVQINSLLNALGTESAVAKITSQNKTNE